MNSHEQEIYIRFCETDAAGYVNSTSFLIYLEEARARFFDRLGIGNENRDVSIGFILASTSCNFLSAARFGQDLKIFTSVAGIGTKSFRIQHEMADAETMEPIASAEAVIVCFDFEEQMTKHVPEMVRAALEGNRIEA
ncbi:acyl-CoA thioesterase [Bacillus marinisedimentorum]|uniref:acyl-CoA thioesterase n=1 Tax=Bacillus marinisedimentorum TaxID=1821260 RepID=UPI00087219E8|nr:thioesterase family protein [Bacillus marinisedimentorum]